MPVVDAPTGHLTLVFSDVQGSTLLWERCPEAMRAALDLHDEILRQRIAGSHGFEVKTEGDAFMVAFAAAGDALHFCLSSQEGLLAAPWPAALLAHDVSAEERGPGGELLQRGLRVRMGIHSGEPDCRNDPITGRMDYFGPVVNRSARIAAAGHGGQVLASGRVFAELEEQLPALGAPVPVDLGEHRLKGLDAPERLIQLLPASLALRSFGPPRTVPVRRTNLPQLPAGFVGRASDLAALQKTLASGARLVTLLGAGGSGKTSLALRWGAGHVPDFAGLWCCDLTEVRDAEGICAAVASALEAPPPAGSSGAAVVEHLGRVLAGRGRTLLVLDNFEQLVPHGPATIEKWLGLAPQAVFLVTSRELLRIPGETVQEVAPLSVPTGDDPRGSEAVQLFVERARAIRPDFALSADNSAAVAGIVRQLDGLPLAIELAAARMNSFTPKQLLERLNRRFDLLSGRREAPSRRATLRGAIDWSWNLLAPHEQAALAQCAVFRGGFTLEAAEAVIDLSAWPEAPWVPDVVQGIRERSLLRAYAPPERPGDLRFAMLESIRAYAGEKLAAPAEVEGRHAAFFLPTAEGWAAQLDGPGGPARLEQLALELENLAAVFERAVASRPMTREHATTATRAATALEKILAHRDPVRLPKLLDVAVELARSQQVEDGLLAELLMGRAVAQRAVSRMNEARLDLEAVLPLARAAGKRLLEIRATHRLAVLAVETGRMHEGRTTLEEARALAAGLDDLSIQAGLSLSDGHFLHVGGKPEAAIEPIQRAVELYHQAGNASGEALALNTLAALQIAGGKLERARKSLTRAVNLHRLLGNRRREGHAIGYLAAICVEEGRFEEAERRFRDGLAVVRDAGDRLMEGSLLLYQGLCLWIVGEREAALAGITAGVKEMRAAGGSRSVGLGLSFRGGLEAALGEEAASRATLAEAQGLLAPLADPVSGTTLALLRGQRSLLAARTTGSPHEAAAHVKQALEAIPPALAPDPATGRSLADGSDEIRWAIRLLEHERPR